MLPQHHDGLLLLLGSQRAQRAEARVGPLGHQPVPLGGKGGGAEHTSESRACEWRDKVWECQNKGTPKLSPTFFPYVPHLVPHLCASTGIPRGDAATRALKSEKRVFFPRRNTRSGGSLSWLTRSQFTPSGLPTCRCGRRCGLSNKERATLTCARRVVWVCRGITTITVTPPLHTRLALHIIYSGHFERAVQVRLQLHLLTRLLLR